MFASLSRWLPRGLCVAVLVAAPAVLSAPAALAQPVEFLGGGYVSDLVNCEGVNFGGGVMLITARYRPGELDGNAESSLIAVNGFSAYAFNLRRLNGVFEDNWVRVQGAQLAPSFEGWDARPRLRVLRQRPTEITEATESMRLRVRVRHMFNIQGCRADIDLELQRQ
ncbi:MAG: hypothetical protein JJT95_11735 [Pararhodobacter sp.]|nr:hypothetical protein [Pararhodobacter sp.]